MCADLWRALGIAPTLQINTLGDIESRHRHRAKLIAYFEAHQDALDEDSKRRLHSNPLRILDSKNPAMQSLNDAAPKLMDELDEPALAHFDALQALLRASGIAYEINPRLVRGLDYYNRTVFEWVTDQLGAQGTVCAGGRYDGLIEQLGGKPAPAAGFAMGIERLLALMEVAGTPLATAVPDAYIVHAGDAAQAFAWQAGGGTAQCRTRHGAALRWRQLQVANEESRRQPRTLCGDHRRRRGRGAAGDAETPARHRRADPRRGDAGNRISESGNNLKKA